MRHIEKIRLYADAIRRIGPGKVVYVAWYRLSLLAGLRRRCFEPRKIDWEHDFFQKPEGRQDYPSDWEEKLQANAQRTVHGNLRFYACHWHHMGDPPDWFLNPFNGNRHPARREHWTKLEDFDTAIGDIKNIWEASRFEWVVTLARAWAGGGERKYGRALNRWLKNWAEENPVNVGPNWRCGQEAAIRVMQMMFAVQALNQWRAPSTSLTELIFVHLERIHGNLGYAIAQDNNHGTSEAAALFIGGSWLARFGGASVDQARAADFATRGRRWLENRLEQLVEPDGSFSQHSVTYHRLLLDTVIYVEFWRRRLAAPAFSKLFYRQAEAVLAWLVAFTDPVSGGAPNLGGNDGAMLLCCHSCDYRDFRPSLQTGAALFHGKTLFPVGPWDEPRYWLGIDADDGVGIGLVKSSKVFSGGYVIMAGSRSWAMLRFPMYRFRPSHNDVFHFDLWHNGVNICRDGGSYSYNTESQPGADYFTSVLSHNTVAFDEGEQMPRLGRFLLGGWMRADQVGSIRSSSDGWLSWSGATTGYRGHRHQRKVSWRSDHWIIEDCLGGNFSKAALRFRLVPATYRIEGNRVIAPWGDIEVAGTGCQVHMESGWESLCYWEKQPVDVLVVRVNSRCRRILTRFHLY